MRLLLVDVVGVAIEVIVKETLRFGLIQEFVMVVSRPRINLKTFVF